LGKANTSGRNHKRDGVRDISKIDNVINLAVHHVAANTHYCCSLLVVFRQTYQQRITLLSKDRYGTFLFALFAEDAQSRAGKQRVLGYQGTIALSQLPRKMLQRDFSDWILPIFRIGRRVQRTKHEHGPGSGN